MSRLESPAARLRPALAGLFAGALGLTLALPVLAEPDHQRENLRQRSEDAARVLGEFMTAKDDEVPRDLIDDAACIAVIPDLAKGAVIVGGRHGKGLVSCRLKDRSWSPPAVMEISGASIGLQIGGEFVDLLLVIKNEKGADYLLRNNFKLGADASIAAGPVGRTVSAATDVQLQAGILSYSKSRGAFVGVSLDGATVSQDKSDNKLLYGRREKVEPREILRPEPGHVLALPPELKAYHQALGRHAGRSAGKS